MEFLIILQYSPNRHAYMLLSNEDCLQRHPSLRWCGRSMKGDGVMSRFVFSDESDDYRRRREELLAAEIALKDQVERVAEMRRALPLGMHVPDYVFHEGPSDLSQNDPADFADVQLADLFTY